MSDYDNEKTGVMFRNRDKGDNEKRPDYKGSALIAGVEYWVSGWVRTKKDTGEKYLSTRYTEKTPRAAAAPTGQSIADQEGGDGMPF
jgi:hypothetical protein